MAPDYKFLLRIANVGILITWKEYEIINNTDLYYKTFLYRSKNRDYSRLVEDEITIRVHWNIGEEEKLHKRLKGAVSVLEIPHYTRLSRTSSQYILEVWHTSRKKLRGIGFIKKDFTTADFHVLYPDNEDCAGTREYRDRSHPFIFLPRVMQPLAEFMIINLLAKTGGTIFHAAGIKDNGEGYAFSGPSDAGKSTMSMYWKRYKGVEVLTDEKLIITGSAGRFRIWGTPWPGGAQVASSDSAPLKKIFFLKKGKGNHADPAIGNSAFRRLLSEVVHPVWDPEKSARIIRVCKKLIDEGTCFELEFKKDTNIVKYIREIKGM